MVLLKVLLCLISFGGLWYGSGLVVEAVKHMAKRLNIPSFAFSFFVLGMLTSIPELAVGINSISENKPEIFVGTYLGGVIVTFLLVIPIMAILYKRVHVRKHLSGGNLLVVLGIISAPALLTLDQTITNTEGFIMIALYVTLFYIVRTKSNVFRRVGRMVEKATKHHDVKQNMALRLIIGASLVFISSRVVVTQTIYFSETYNVSAFILSLLVLSLGANLPEIALAIRSYSSKAEDVAIGDYIGSAAANTLLFGMFTLINNGEVVTGKSFFIPWLFIVVAMLAFFFMTRGKSDLTRKEGLMLVGLYALFIASEVASL